MRVRDYIESVRERASARGVLKKKSPKLPACHIQQPHFFPRVWRGEESAREDEIQISNSLQEKCDPFQHLSNISCKTDAAICRAACRHDPERPGRGKAGGRRIGKLALRSGRGLHLLPAS